MTNLNTENASANTSTAKTADVTWSTQTHIALDPETLFHYLADFSSVRNWDPHVTDAQLTTPGPLRVGSEIALDFRLGFYISKMQYEVQSYEPARKIVLKGSTPLYHAIDTIEVKPDPSNPNWSLVSYGLELFYQKPNMISVNIGKYLTRYFANKALRNLKRLALPDSSRVRPASAVLDRTVFGGIYQFTRFGFFNMKKRSHPLPVSAKGLKAVITGSTAGIGREIATELARAQVEIIMVNRTQHKADDFAASLRERFGATVHSYITDMSNIDSTVKTMKTIAQDFPQIDILINNAGELLNDRQETSEGFEHNFAVLLLAPFVVTQTLLPSLQSPNENRTDNPARVINMCSGGLYTQGLHLEDLQYKQGEFNGAKAYARAKRGLLDITEHYSRTIDKYKVVFHAMHPGWVHTPGVEKSLASFLKTTKAVLRTPFQGADTAIWLALSQVAGQSSGLFWLDRQPHTTSIFPGTKTHPTLQSELYARLDLLQKQNNQNPNVLANTLDTEQPDTGQPDTKKPGTGEAQTTNDVIIPKQA